MITSTLRHQLMCCLTGQSWLEHFHIFFTVSAYLQLVRTRLEDSSPDAKMVESLIPMWDEEKMRCSGNLPERPGSPPRNPGPLCQTVEDIRAQFQVLVDPGYTPEPGLSVT